MFRCHGPTDTCRNAQSKHVTARNP
jgi:hypothetical protein